MTINAKYTFGWNPDTWQKTFLNSKEVQKVLARKNLDILEVGAGKYSQVSYEFDKTISNITVGFYDDKAEDIHSALCRNKEKLNLESSYTVSYIDVFNLTEKFDVIIMKSVLGAIFRGDEFAHAEDFCLSLVENNLNNNGVLITVDNGKSLFERFVQNFGARKNNWYFITMDELPLADEKIGFGVVSFFAPSTRFKFVGRLLELCFYYVDCILSPLLKSNPTVVCSIYLNKTPRT